MEKRFGKGEPILRTLAMHIFLAITNDRCGYLAIRSFTNVARNSCVRYSVLFYPYRVIACGSHNLLSGLSKRSYFPCSAFVPIAMYRSKSAMAFTRDASLAR